MAARLIIRIGSAGSPSFLQQTPSSLGDQGRFRGYDRETHPIRPAYMGTSVRCAVLANLDLCD